MFTKTAFKISYVINYLLLAALALAAALCLRVGSLFTYTTF